jgi:hypothetical protein
MGRDQETITCPICGLQWRRSGARANEVLLIDDVAYRTKCKHLDAGVGFACPKMRAANSKARQEVG